MKFIDLKEVGRGRTSSLSVIEDELDKNHFTTLQVIGVLPHGYQFTPKTVKDAERIIEVMTSWIKRQDELGN